MVDVVNSVPLTSETQKRDHNQSGIAIRIDTHKQSQHDAELDVRHSDSFINLKA